MLKHNLKGYWQFWPAQGGRKKKQMYSNTEGKNKAVFIPKIKIGVHNYTSTKLIF